MLKLYHALVRSSYGLASSSVMQTLNTIQATGLHYRMGVPRLTLTETLHVETDEMPLYSKKEKLTAQYHLRSLAMSETHPINIELPIACIYFLNKQCILD